MSRKLAGSYAGLIVLVLAPISVYAQLQQPRSTASEKPPEVLRQSYLIVSLLEQLADQARGSDDLAFAVRAQSQAATLLWPQAPERARSIYRRAFESISIATSPKLDQKSNTSGASTNVAQSDLSVARKRQLRGELLNQIASRDAELAEELARSIADKADAASRDCVGLDCSSASNDLTFASNTGPAPSREDAERRELLMSAALQVVEREPQQAMAFAQMSVASGISSNLARFLSLLRAVDAERADLLFSNAVARLEESSSADLSEIHTLGSFVLSAVNSSKQPLGKQLVIRFLNLALNRISLDLPAAFEATSRDESAAYFVGRQLTELVSRYLPDRAAQLRPEASGATAPDAGLLDVLEDSGGPGVRSVEVIEREARETTDKTERDSLWASAALEQLARGELRKANEAALAIANDATRDRVLVPIIRRYSYDKRIEDALAVARRVADVSLRGDMVVMLANDRLALKDEAHAIELLNEAAGYSAKAPPIDRARSLIRIAGGFATFDAPRAFDTLQSAIKAINDATKMQQDAKDDPASNIKTGVVKTIGLDDLNSASLERTLSMLAQSDFNWALSLAQQLSVQEASIIAQLAVCKAGLAARTPVARDTVSDETESAPNH